MNFEINRLRIDEVEINIKALVQSCLQKIRFIIICGIVCGILIPALVYVVDVKNYNAQKNASLESIEIKLTDEEKVTVDTYLLLKNRVEQLKNYQNKSLVLNVDNLDIYQGDISFHVEAEENLEYDIACAITNGINDTVFLSKLKENGIITNYEYGFVDTGVIGVSTGMSSGVFTVRVYALSETECKEYVENVKFIIKAYSDEIQGRVAEHKLTLVSEIYSNGYSESVFQKQKTFIDNWQSANALLTTSQAGLNANQLMYISSLNTEQETVDVDMIKPNFSIVFAIIGIILGLVVGIAIVCVQVIFGGKIQTEQEMLKRLNISNLGTSKDIDLVVVRIENMIQALENKSVGLISTTDVFSREFVEQLEKKLREKKITCEIVGNIVKNPMAYNKAAEISNIIMVEVLGETKIKDVYDESMACKDLGVEVVGYITAR